MATQVLIWGRSPISALGSTRPQRNIFKLSMVCRRRHIKIDFNNRQEGLDHGTVRKLTLATSPDLVNPETMGRTI
eukprot:scaffold23675_cov108-Cylindrotheca_fusiformis.AAC.5